MKSSTLIGTFLVCAMLPYSAESEPKSSIVFYDTTGQNPTGTIGWRGSASDGHFFVETPSASGPLEVKKGNLTVNGTVEAQSLSGDGSGVTNVPVADGTVTTAKIADGAVTTAKLDNSAVSSPKIASGAINNGKLAQDAVRGKNLNDTCVATAHIKDGAVTDAKIGSVSWEKVSNKPEIPGGTVGDGTITTDKLVDGAVTNAKVASITWDKISDPPSIGSGDITGVSAGTGLSGGGDNGDVSIAVSFTTSGGANRQIVDSPGATAPCIDAVGWVMTQAHLTGEAAPCSLALQAPRRPRSGGPIRIPAMH